MTKERPWQLFHTVLLATCVLLLILFAILPWPLAVGSPQSRLVTWWLTAGLLVLALLTMGHGLVGRYLGVFIDNRNMMSLSRLQLVIWTVVVLSGFYTIALWNLRNGSADPLSVGIPQELWWLLGISTASLVGSPLIQSTKRDKELHATLDFQRKKELLLARRSEKFKAAARSAAAGVAPGSGPAIAATTPPEGAIKADGQLVVFDSPDMAGPGDLFGGEETGNLSVLDIGKVQMFFFTIIIVLAYTTALLTNLAGSSLTVGFPHPDQAMVALLGISHAGYLANKAAPHSPSTDPQNT